MKTNLYFAALMGMLALSSCSKEQNGPAEQQSKALPSMTIKLEAPKTYAGDTDSPKGNESKLTMTYVFVNVGTDATGSGAKYTCIPIGANTQTSVKFPIVGSTVFTLSNITTAEFATIKTAVDGAGTPAAAATYLESYVNAVDKAYIGGLTQDGSFLMSGKAVVNDGGGVSPYQLPITLNRDIVKTSFKVNKTAMGANGGTAPTINAITRIIISRGAAKVHPFKVDGVAPSGYELTPGWDEIGYKGDYLTLDANLPTGTFGTIKNTEVEGGATDFTFEHAFANKTDRDCYIFEPFYVLPNNAQSAVRGTIILLEAQITVDGESTSKAAYYKARLSSDLTTFASLKNSHYIITATLKGTGSDKPVVGENEDDNLIVTVTVADWAMILSGQEIE